MFSGLVSDLEDPGDYFLYNIGRESIVILRQTDDDIGAFYNVCQHRGNRIFTGSNDYFVGHVKEVACPFEEMQLAKHQTVLIEANWKTVRDNFLEQYHVDFIHPQQASLVDCCNSTNVLWPHGHSATMVEGYVTDSRYPEQRRKRELGPELGFDYSSLSDEQVSDVWQFDLFPNTFMTIQAEELWIYGPRPLTTNPNQCFFDKWTLQYSCEIATDVKRGLTLSPSLVASREDERPDHAVFTADDVIAGEHTLTITLDQDIYLLADMQAGMHSRGFRSTVLNQDEVRVQHFHDWLDRCFEDNV